MAEGVYASNYRNLWKEVKRIKPNTKTVAASVDGAVNSKDIADIFKRKYEDLYNCNKSCVNNMNAVRCEIDRRVRCASSDGAEIFIDVKHVREAIKELKLEKSDGLTGLVSNNIICGPEILHVYISLLFSCVLRHGYTPWALLSSVIIPIPKNVRGDLESSDNYRGISLCSSLLKLFEIIIMNMCKHSLCTSSLQFAFKNEHSTTMCVSVFKEILSYYRSRDTNVYCCFLDATKAFDRLQFDKLFELLCTRNMPCLYLRILLDMYERQSISVSWNGEQSGVFTGTNGVRQGGIISPLLFNVYIDVLLNKLKKQAIGCHVGHMFTGCLGYADDVTLIAPSIGSLQTMLSTCESYGLEYQVRYNTKKTVCMHFDSSNILKQYDVYLSGKKLNWVSHNIYLGVKISNDLDDFAELQYKRAKYFVSVNNLLSGFKGVSSDVLNKLFSYYCTSFYGSQSWNLRNRGIHSIVTAYNRGLRLVWRLPYNSHTKIVLATSQCLPMSVILEKRFLNMFLSMYQSVNMCVAFLARRSLNDMSCFLGTNLGYLKVKYSSDLLNCDSVKCMSNIVCSVKYDSHDLVLGSVVRDLVKCREGQYNIVNLSSDSVESLIVALTTD